MAKNEPTKAAQAAALLARLQKVANGHRSSTPPRDREAKGGKR